MHPGRRLRRPSSSEKIKSYKVCDIITFDGKIDKEFIKGLNGEFLIIVFSKLKGLMSVANDRFTSIPFYYHVDPADGSITASMFFSDLWGRLKQDGRLKMSQTSFFEFLWFQRLFGVKNARRGRLLHAGRLRHDLRARRQGRHQPLLAQKLREHFSRSKTTRTSWPSS